VASGYEIRVNLWNLGMNDSRLSHLLTPPTLAVDYFNPALPVFVTESFLVHHEHSEPPNRRTFLDWAIHGIGALFAVVFGAPAVAYLIDPRNRPSPAGDFRPVAGVKLSEIGAAPVQGVIRNVRRDAWTLYPSDVIGRVWIHRVRPGNDQDCFQIFSTVCPHLGCSINGNADQAANPGFTCPCHNGQFSVDGVRRPNGPGYENPAPRDMDALEFRIVGETLEVKYQVFEAARSEKIVRT
jgi:menaquinol-cytochrome c reductase iron-sulfur subunit